MVIRKIFNSFLLSIGSVVLFIPFGLANEGTDGTKGIVSTQVDTAKKLIDLALEYVVKYSFQALGGVIVLIIGWIVGGYVEGLVNKFLATKKLDVTVAKFISGAVKILVVVFAVIVALGKFGIEVAPLIAGISVAGFGLSFALQGPLSNYASGATLIFTKPFKVGDIIEVAGVTGEVVDMKLPRTDIKTIDGTLIFIPNKHIIGEIIHNYSAHKRVDIKVGVGYKSDVQKAIEIVKSVIKVDARTVANPKVGISDFGDSSVNIYARLWCKQDQYWDILFDLNKKIFDEFKKNNIEIPFPQRDVHVYRENL